MGWSTSRSKAESSIIARTSARDQEGSSMIVKATPANIRAALEAATTGESIKAQDHGGNVSREAQERRPTLAELALASATLAEVGWGRGRKSAGLLSLAALGPMPGVCSRRTRSFRPNATDNRHAAHRPRLRDLDRGRVAARRCRFSSRHGIHLSDLIGGAAIVAGVAALWTASPSPRGDGRP